MEPVIKGVGGKRSELILIGEAPGEEELHQGLPFVGPSGKIQDGLLLSAGTSREKCFLDNIIPIRPPGNKMGRLVELGVRVEDFLPNLTQTLRSLSGRVVIGYGDTALYYLTGKGDLSKKGEISGISKHRGSIYPCLLDPNKMVVPTFHPRFIIENWKMRGVVVEDIKKGLRVGREGYQEPLFNTILKPPLREIEEFFSEVKKTDRFSFDIETVGSGQIACLGLGRRLPNSERLESLCIPFKFGYQNYWGEGDEIYIWELVRELFQTDLLKIGQNLNFDLSKLLPFIGEPSPPWFDLMLAHHLIDPELPHTLAFITSLYTNPTVNYYKDDPKDEEKSWRFTTSSEQLWEYNGKDCEVPLMVEPRLREELKELKMLSFFEGFLMPKSRVLWRVQQRGMLLDEEKRGELLTHQTTELKEKQEILSSLVGYPLNPNSSKQMIKFLYEDLKLPVQRDRKTKLPTTNKEALEKLFVYHPNPAFKLALEIRDKVKEIGTYLMVEADLDGRVRGRYSTSGTTTGRSSSKKGYEGRGLDFHNIPEEDRQMFVPQEGNSFIIRDLWQAEALAVSVLSQCQSFLKRLQEGKKTHRLVASWLFNKEEKDIDSNNKPGGEYYTGKRVGHGLNYGLGPVLLAITVKCSVSNAKKYRDLYFKFAPEIEQWHSDIKEELKRTRQLSTPFGRKRFFRDRLGDDLFRKGFAFVPQSLVAEVNHLGMIKLEYLLPTGAEILQEGYDSVLIETKDDLIEKVKQLMESAFDKEIYTKGTFFKIPGEVIVGKRWAK